VAGRAAEWRRLKALLLDSVSLPITKRAYNLGLNEFIAWYTEEPRPPGFTKATVSGWRVALEARGLGPDDVTRAALTMEGQIAADCTPDCVTRTLAGFKSRWACLCRVRLRARRRRPAPAELLPSEQEERAAERPRSCSVQMLEWLRAATARASRRKRSENWFEQNLIARSRRNRVSHAFQHFANAAFADGRDKFIRAEFIAVLSFHGDGWIASIHYIVTSESALREVSFGAPDGLFL